MGVRIFLGKDKMTCLDRSEQVRIDQSNYLLKIIKTLKAFKTLCYFLNFVLTCLPLFNLRSYAQIFCLFKSSSFLGESIFLRLCLFLGSFFFLM